MKEDKYLRLIAYLEGDMSKMEKSEFEKLLSADNTLHDEYERLQKIYKAMDADDKDEVPEVLRSDFETILEAERQRQKKNNQMKQYVGMIAAGVALVIIGVWVGMSLRQEVSDTQGQLQAMQEEIKMNRQLMLDALKQESASKRFTAVNATQKVKSPDKKILRSLIEVMNTDDNTNVRLAAVRALSEFYEMEMVKQAFLDALLTQSDPLVQVTLINILVDIEEKNVKPTLERLIKSDTTIDAVKDEAYWGMLKLS